MENYLTLNERKLINIFNDNGITFPIFNHAKMMDFNLIKLFNDKIFNNYNEKSLEVVTKNLLGVYGNYIASNYFKVLGFKVENEKDIKDKNNIVLTKADISFIDKEGNLNLCEVKATPQIIDNIRNYVDKDEQTTGTYTDKDEEIIKYKNIGKKLIKQVGKLKTSNSKVNVVIFLGCFIDDIIKEKLARENVNIITINVDINELENNIRKMVVSIKKDYENIIVQNNNTINFMEFKRNAA